VRSASGKLPAAPVSPLAQALLRKLHQTIRKITQDFAGRWHFNTCVAAIMELVNELYVMEDRILSSAGEVVTSTFLADVQRDLVLLLAPFAPYLAHELWEMLGQQGSLLRAPWPKYDPVLAKEEEIEIPVQVNGKLRGVIIVPVDSPQELVLERALAEEKIKAAIGGKETVKVIFVPGKLINIVVR